MNWKKFEFTKIENNSDFKTLEKNIEKVLNSINIAWNYFINYI